MIITKEWLQNNKACSEGVVFADGKGLLDLDHKSFIEKLIEYDHFDYANWLITHILRKENNVRYAIFAAELVLHIYEKKYPNDDSPRKAIEAAKKYLNNSTYAAACSAACSAASDATYDAAYNACSAASDATYDAAYNACSAAYNACSAAYAAACSAAPASAAAAAAAADAARHAAYAASAAVCYAAAKIELTIKIITHGLKLIEEQENAK